MPACDPSTTAATAGDVVIDDFDDFYSSTVRHALAVAVTLTGNWADAEDLVQDAYADAHRRWGVIGHYDDPAAWVRRAVANRATSRWRRIGRELRALSRISVGRHDEALADVFDDPALWRAVGTLPIQQRRAVALFYVADLPIAAVAADLGCSVGAVKTHLARARASLREAIFAATEQETTDA